MLRFVSGLLVGVAVAGGALTASGTGDESTAQGLWADFCIYKSQDASSWIGLPYGSAYFVQGIAGNWSGFITEREARRAIGDYDCHKVY